MTIKAGQLWMGADGTYWKLLNKEGESSWAAVSFGDGKGIRKILDGDELAKLVFVRSQA
jgi:hypothetical protein